ncbi:MAG: FAD-binding oxidoreductase [Desulfobacterota bacterium]|nr:FAD-binding oxidoreductase [Thermodesulfobacteriota bacterium]
MESPNIYGNTKKVIPLKLPGHVIAALEDVVGKQWVTQDRAILETYSKFSVDSAGTLRKHKRDATTIPACVVLPQTTEDVQAIVRIANRFGVPFIPFTNGFVAASGPTCSKPTICIHLSRMNRILSINTDTMTATVEAFVDYGQLQAEAMKRGLWNGGTPLATSICKLSSQTALAGVWQTDLKYGTLSRNIVSAKVVLPTGHILITGSNSVAGFDPFWEFGPGPDLFSMIRGAGGTSGIITEITVKLHPWPGPHQLPEPAAGRPFLHSIANPDYDMPPPPENIKLLWVEFPDFESELAALQAIARAGIGFGLNATGVYNAYYCSPTQEMTLARLHRGFFPPYNCYLAVAGFVSPAQLTYEEKIFNEIVAECGGTVLSASYKPDVLAALMNWNLDCIRHVTGFRMNRHTYGGSIVPLGTLRDVAHTTREVWRRAIERFGATYPTDRGGINETPFLYALDRYGRFWLSEADVYPDPTDPEKLATARKLTFSANVDFVARKRLPPVQGVLLEPYVSAYPECGPHAYRLMRILRQVFDPRGVCAPGRQVYTEDELKAIPRELLDFINDMRAINNMPPISV